MSEIKDKLQTRNLYSPSKRDLQSDPKKDPKKLEAAKMFEGQFIRQIIAEMRKTVPEDELVPETMGEKVFKDQLDDQYAENWVNNGGIGLGNLIYDQLEARYGQKNVGHAKGHPGEMMKLPENPAPTNFQKKQTSQNPTKNSSDLFSNRDRDLFLLKKTANGFHIKSREPLPENVDLRAPLSGTVVQAAALGEGKQMVILKHDEGLNLQFVHSGLNRVQPGDQVLAGQTIAQLPASRQGERADVFFGLRKGNTVE